MKKTIAAALAALLLLTLFFGCGKTDGGSEPADEAAGLKIVTTIFPIYDWTRNVLGEKAADADLRMLLDSGADLHNFQPTLADMKQIADCDVFIFVGGESDAWVKDTLASNPDMIALSLMDALGANLKEEELKEGMQAEEEEEEAGVAYDEHIWLSLKNAAALCGVIAERLGEADAENAESYKANAAAYVDRINALDADYRAAADNAKTRTLLFADRFPFRYMTDDYGLDYFAAFVGCSAETEVSLDTEKFLSEKIDELGLKYVCVLTGSDEKIAGAVISATAGKDQQILRLDSLQSVTAEDVANGADYLATMGTNLETLKTALS